MADPYRCLRVSTIAIAFYNIVYCLAQFGILGWQVKAVKILQWEYENRQLPATGSIDGFQARFPGLYAIYTETPERRRINAMYAIVLICLGLSIIHLMTTVSMLYGAIKRASNWILPWFFTCAPIVIMCTAYAVLWWSGDVFNEQLTMSVAEFVMSLAINGICFIVVLLYFLRITGRLTSERPAATPRAAFSNYSLDYGGGGGIRQYPPRLPSDEMPIYPKQKASARKIIQQQQNYQEQRRPASAPNLSERQRKRARSRSPFAEPTKDLPPWHERMPDQPSYSVDRKMRRRTHDRARSPTAALRQDYKHFVSYPTSAQRFAKAPHNDASMRRRTPRGGAVLTPPTCAANASQSAIANTPIPQTQYVQIQNTRNTPPRRRITSGAKRQIAPPMPANCVNPKSDANFEQYPRAKQREILRPSAARMDVRPHKSPQRVSFKSRPKIYERTPESSLSGNGHHREIHTIV